MILKSRFILIMLVLFTGLLFSGCKEKKEISVVDVAADVLSETLDSETKVKEDLVKEKIEKYIPEEIDVSSFTPVKKEQFACLPGCFVSSETDMPLYETQNVNSSQTGTFNGKDVGYVKECGIHPEGKQWFYVVDEYTGDKGWLLCDEKQNILKSNIECVLEKNSYIIHDRKNAVIGLKENYDFADVKDSYSSYIFSSDNKYMGDWNSYEKNFRLYDINDNFNCKNINLYSNVLSKIDKDIFQGATFSPDGKKIIFAYGKDIYEYVIENEQTSLLFSYPLDIKGIISDIFISPDQNLYYFNVHYNDRSYIYSYDAKKKEGSEIIVEPSKVYNTYNCFSNFVFNPDNNDFSFTVWLHDKLYSGDSYKGRKLCTVKASEWPEVRCHDIDVSCSTENVSYLNDGNLFFANSTMVKYSSDGKIINNRRYVSIPDCFEIRKDRIISSDGNVVAEVLSSYRDVGMLSRSCRIYFYSAATMNLLFVKEFDFSDKGFNKVYWNGDRLFFIVAANGRYYIKSFDLLISEKKLQEKLISENHYRMNENLANLCLVPFLVQDLSQGYVEYILDFIPNGSYELTVSAGESGEFLEADVGAYSLGDGIVKIYKPDYSKQQGTEEIFSPKNNLAGEYTISKENSESRFGNAVLYKNGSPYAKSYVFFPERQGLNGELIEFLLKTVPEEQIVISRDRKKVKDTMYVNSKEGLKVRDKPSLKSNRICGLKYRFPVKCTAVGKKETIDGITASWIEILLPRYEWSGEEPEYGWVFGGYLSPEKPEFVSPGNADELKELLCSYPCWRSSKYPGFCFHFNVNGKFWCGAHEKGEVTVGTYKIADNDHLVITSTFMGLGDDDYKETVNDFFISDLSEFSFYYRGPFFPYHKDTTFYGFFYSWDLSSVLEESKKDPFIYNSFYRSVYEQEDDFVKEYFEKEVLNNFIRYGISAEGTEYEDLYHEYWDPIMKERQRRADSLEF